MCFGVIDIIFIVAICLSLFGTPDYSVIIDKMDSIERERKIQVDSLMEVEQEKREFQLDSIGRKLEEIYIQLDKQSYKISSQIKALNKKITFAANKTECLQKLVSTHCFPFGCRTCFGTTTTFHLYTLRIVETS